MFLSIIIPTLNEEKYIASAISTIERNVSNKEGIEIIIVDAGSADQTLSILKNYHYRVEVKKKFKGKKYESLNYGASISTGDVLFFLDADSMVPEEFDLKIQNAINDKGILGGAFEYQAENQSMQFRVIQLINRLRYRVDRLYFGDQGIFCLTNKFKEVGGYPEEPIMEASFLCKRLRTIGKTGLIKSPIITSTRRFEKEGKWNVFFSDMFIWMRFLVKIDIKKHAPNYWKENEVVIINDN